MAGFLTNLPPLEHAWQLSRGRWEFGYSSHQMQVGNACPVSLNPPLGSRFMVSAWPEAGSPQPVPRRSGNVGLLSRPVVSPSNPPQAILGRGVTASGILRPMEPAAGAAEIVARPALAESEGWAPRQVEISTAGREMPGLPETIWESCATIAPEPAERWLSLVVAKEPVITPRAAGLPRFALTAETAECFRDVAAAPPAVVETWMPGLVAEAAERWIQPAAAEPFAARCAVVAPSFQAAILRPAPEAAGWAAVPPAEAVERWIQPAVAGHLALGGLDVRMQPFAMEAQGAEVLRDPADAPPPVAEAFTPPAAEPVERWLQPACAGAAEWAIPVSMPEPAMAATVCAPAPAGTVPSLLAEAAERWIEPVMAETLAVGGHTPRTLPFAVAASCPDRIPRSGRCPAAARRDLGANSRRRTSGAMAAGGKRDPSALCPGPGAGAGAFDRGSRFDTRDGGRRRRRPPRKPSSAGWSPRPRWASRPPATRFARCRSRLPGHVRAILRDPADVPPPIQEAWMPVPAAEPVERWLEAATAAALAPVPAAADPGPRSPRGGAVRSVHPAVCTAAGRRTGRRVRQAGILTPPGASASRVPADAARHRAGGGGRGPLAFAPGGQAAACPGSRSGGIDARRAEGPDSHPQRAGHPTRTGSAERTRAARPGGRHRNLSGGGAVRGPARLRQSG